MFDTIAARAAKAGIAQRRRRLQALRHLRPLPRLHRGAGGATAASRSTTRASTRSSSKQQERARAREQDGRGLGRPRVPDASPRRRRPCFLGYDRARRGRRDVLAMLKDGKPCKRLDAGEDGEIIARPHALLRGGGRPDRRPRRPRLGRLGGRGHGLDEPPAGALTSTSSPWPTGGFERGMDVRAVVDEERRRGAPCATTPHPPPATRRCARPSAPTSSRRAASSRTTACASTSPTTPRVDARELRVIENRVNGEILPTAPGRAEGDGPRRGARLRGARVLRRQVRRARARGRGAGLLEGVLRRHPRRPDRRHRLLPLHRRAGRLRGHPARRGGGRRGGPRARPGRPGHPRRARAVRPGRPPRAGRRVREAARAAQGPRSRDRGPQDEARHGGHRPRRGFRRPDRGRGDDRVDAPVRGARPQGARGRGGRVPEPEQGPPLCPRVDLVHRRGGECHRGGVAIPHRLGEGPRDHEAAGPARGRRPDFAQGGGVAPGDVEALRDRARELLRAELGGRSG